MAFLTDVELGLSMNLGSRVRQGVSVGWTDPGSEVVKGRGKGTGGRGGGRRRGEE